MIAKQIISLRHRKFCDFAMKLIEVDGCDHNFDYAIEVLNTIPEADIPGTLEWFRSYDVHCDCEIVHRIIYRMFDYPIIP